jgi:NADPH-dependent 2,4-dienoyl-CoA reductase/sulfur reductase-like enzyme
MTYEDGWEREYTRAVKTVSTKPVLLVGRITRPNVAEELLASGDADAILLARQLFADAEWAAKAREGKEDDIRRCVAANYCWRAVIRGGRVQCIYNPTVGRERQWGTGTLDRADGGKRALVVGAGPAGLEYARVAAARGHAVVVLEREAEVGGHVRSFSKLPGRAPFYGIAEWLATQARGNGAEIRVSTEAGADDADGFDHVVVASGARYTADGFQGQTAGPLPGYETGRCVAWDAVALGKESPAGNVLVIDDLQDAAAPLTAIKLAEAGCSVRLVTRWPMFGMETIPEVYFIWIQSRLYEAGVTMMTDHFVERIDGDTVTLFNVYQPDSRIDVRADWIVMATGRHSENSLYHALRERGASVECIGDAVAPRGTYEAVYEGHRAARRL